MTTTAKRLYILLCGFEIIPKTISTKDRGGRFIMSEPISAYLVETSDGYILFDTGIDTGKIEDPEKRQKFFLDHGWTPPPVVLPEHELLTQLDLIGVKPTDICDVVLSHVHADHTGNLQHFRHATVHIQRLEYEYAFGENIGVAVFRDDFDFPDIKWNIVEGDWELVPGVEFVLTRGHMPGHQSAVVTLPNNGAMVLTADAGDLLENFSEEILPGETCDSVAALQSIRRLKKIVDERPATMILGHDPVLIQQLKLAPDYYD